MASGGDDEAEIGVNDSPTDNNQPTLSGAVQSYSEYQ